jgi:hypothetical protein
MITEEEIEARRTRKGGWTRHQLEEWGVGWPPPKGWKERLLRDNGLEMKTAKKIQWDDASFIIRTDPEREPKPRPKPGKIPRFQKQEFDFEAAKKAWAAVGVIVNEKEILEDMAKLKAWERRLEE